MYTPTLAPRPNDLVPNNFQPVGNFGSYEEYSTIYDRPIPEQMYVLGRHAEYIGFGMMLRAMGNVKGCSTPSTGHYEEPWKEDLLKFSAITTPAGGAGNTLIATLHADMMYDTGVTIGGAARQASYVLAKDIIEFPSGNQARVESKNISVTPHRVTLKPLLSTVDLDDEVETGVGYHNAYNLFGEGSASAGIRSPRYIKYSNTFGIVKSAWGITGSEETNRVYFQPVPGQEGSIALRLSPDMYYHQEKARDGLLLFGQNANNLTELDTNDNGLNIDISISGSEGYVSFAKTGGTISNYTPGSYSLTNLNAVGQILEDERSATDGNILALTGSAIHIEREDALAEFLSNNLTPFVDRLIPGYSGFDFNAIADTNEKYDASYSFGIYHIHKAGWHFFFKKLPAFNDIKRAGAEGYNYKATTIYQPVGENVKTSTSSSMPTMGYEFKQLNGRNRDLVYNYMPGAGTRQGMVSHDRDTYKEMLLSEIAPHFACANRIVYEEPEG